MGVAVNLQDAARELEAIAKRLETGLQAAVATSTAELQRFAEEQSSGPLSSAELAALDHPFAKRHGSPQLPPDLIHTQTGVFRASWGSEVTPGQGLVFNLDPKAAFLEGGTDVMFQRHPEQAALEREEDRFAARVEAALEKAFG